mgnify:CR=1 FL=1
MLLLPTLLDGENRRINNETENVTIKQSPIRREENAVPERTDESSNMLTSMDATTPASMSRNETKMKSEGTHDHKHTTETSQSVAHDHSHDHQNKQNGVKLQINAPSKIRTLFARS